MSRIKTLLVLVGIATLGGTTYLITTPRPGVTWPELLDAGLAGRCTARLVECRARYVCGARPRYVTAQTKAAVCDIPGDDQLVVLRWPVDGGMRCYEPVGTPEEACRPVQAGCTDGTLCGTDSEVMPVREEVQACACRRASGTCTWDPDGAGPMPSRPAPLGATLGAGTWAGTGCLRKYCGPELAGEQGGSWPAECPE